MASSEVLVTGASGMLGSAVVRALCEQGRVVTGVVNAHGSEADGARIVVRDLAATGAAAALVSELRPAWLIHCAAMTDVDACEADLAAAWRLNADVPRELAEAAERIGTRVIHMSTDAVFDGARGWYAEDDEPGPLNTYSRSKLEAERAVTQASPGAIVVRATIFGRTPYGKPRIAEWFLMSLRARRRVTGFWNVIFTPVLVDDLAEIFIALMDQGAGGLYHVASTDACSKYDFGVRIARLFGLDETLITAGRLGDATLAAPRPLDTSLRSDKVARHLGRAMPSIDDGLRRFRALDSDAARLRAG